MGRHIADQARKIFFKIPAQMIHQPIDFGRELNIAFHMNRRLITIEQFARQLQRVGFGHGQSQVDNRRLV